MKLSRGQRARLAELVPNGQRLSLGIGIEAPGLVTDVACFGLDGQGRLADERYMTFFNQPSTPCGGVGLEAPAGDTAGFAIDLGRLPASIERLAITAAIDGAGTMSRIVSGQVRLLDAGTERASFPFSGTDFADERALILLEIYRKDGTWRLCALGQGFNGGLEALVRSFGGSVAETPPPPAPAPAPVNLGKITLDKRGSSVSLDKRAGAELGEILINLNWSAPAAKPGLLSRLRGGGIDLDLGCLYELRDGTKSAVQALGDTFGNYAGPPYVALDADDRSGQRNEGENLRINGAHWNEIARILVYAFIYRGVTNWAEADARIRIRSAGQPEIEVRLDSHRNDRQMCAIAMLENQQGAVRITKLVDYHRGHLDMDQRYNWGLDWVRGRKD